MIRILYNLLFPLFFWASSPFYLLKLWRRGNWRAGFGQRFGMYTPELRKTLSRGRNIWFHAVSVGEVNICVRLIRELHPRLSGMQVVVSTTTSTGMGELQRQLPANAVKIYYPVDFPSCVNRAFSAINPAALVLVEAEIWPNFLWQAGDLGIPLFLVNARLSEKSYRGYSRFGRLFRPLFGSFSKIGAQNDPDAARLRQLGCGADAVCVTGNLKFDAATPDMSRALDVAAMLRQLSVPDTAALLVAGSTHDGEEAILAAQYQRLRKLHPGLFLVLVPRHFERCKDLAAELERGGLRCALRTELQGGRQWKPGEADCLLVNTTGELKYFYAHATVVFVGKSLTAEGGQNPIEPAALGKAMVFGPNMQNFKAIARGFVERGGAVQVPNAEELERAFLELLANPARRAALGEQARKLVEENQGAARRTVEMIENELRARGMLSGGQAEF